jgi:hypothetical protein
MSHTSTIKAIKIVSIQALRSAVEELASGGIRCRLEDGGTPRAFYPNQPGLGAADYVLKLDDCPYDVGFYKSDDGKSYEARTDFWMGHVEKILGTPASKPEHEEQAKMGKLFQKYAVNAATEEARRKGLQVRRQTADDGTVKLVLSGANL